MNLTELLDKTASRWPQKAALVEGNIKVSYADLAGQITALASKLATFSISSGTRVALCYPNSIAYVALTYALWRLNAVVVPIPMEGSEKEIASTAAAMQVEGILSQKPLPNSRPVSSDVSFLRLTPDLPPDNHGLNIAFIRFTSGTTSARKGVVLCHETIRDRIGAANEAFRIGPSDTIIWCLPMAHHFLITIVLYLSEGATIVLARHVASRPFLDAVNLWHGTFLYAAPFHYALLARDGSNVGIPSVRLAVSTTCALPDGVADDFFKRFRLPLVQALGVIELGLVSLNTDPRNRWNSVGRPLPQYRLRILSPDESGCGDIAVSGPGFFDAYATPWLPRDKLMEDGWFRTGDIGRLDADGYLFLIGRKSAVINLAGRKVFPEEIEAVLNRHPAVRESRVFGRPHPHLGEVVEADLVLSTPDADLDAIGGFCRENLASFKIPARFHVVTELPRTDGTGKIRRAPVFAC